jgi:hypothetical protein
MSSSGRSGPVTHFFIASGTAAGAILHGLTFTTNQLDDTLHHLHRVDTRLWLAKQYTSLPLNAEDLAMLLGFSYVLFGLLTLVPSTYPPSQGGAGSRGELHRVPPEHLAGGGWKQHTDIGFHPTRERCVGWAGVTDGRAKARRGAHVG